MKTRIASNWRPFLHAFLIAIVVLWAMPRNARAQTNSPQPSTPIGAPQSKPYQPQAPSNELRQLINQIDQKNLRATVEKLVSFGTRHTGSSQTDPARGIGAATDWVFQQLQTYAASSSGNMTVQK